MPSYLSRRSHSLTSWSSGRKYPLALQSTVSPNHSPFLHPVWRSQWASFSTGICCHNFMDSSWAMTIYVSWGSGLFCYVCAKVCPKGGLFLQSTIGSQDQSCRSLELCRSNSLSFVCSRSIEVGFPLEETRLPTGGSYFILRSIRNWPLMGTGY